MCEVLFCKEVLPPAPQKLPSKSQCGCFLYIIEDDESSVEEVVSQLPTSPTPSTTYLPLSPSEHPLVPTDTSVVTPLKERPSQMKRRLGGENVFALEDGEFEKRASKRCKVSRDFHCKKEIPLPCSSGNSKYERSPSMPCNIVTPMKNKSESFYGPILADLEENKYDWDSLDLFQDIPELIPECMFDCIPDEKPKIPHAFSSVSSLPKNEKIFNDDHSNWNKTAIDPAIFSSTGLSPLHEPRYSEESLMRNHDFLLSGINLEGCMGDMDFSLHSM